MSSNLLLTQLTSSQNAYYATANDANGEIDAKLTEEVVITFESGDSQAITITEVDATRNLSFVINDDVAFSGGAPETNVLTYPLVKGGVFLIRNDAQRLLEIKTASQSLAEDIQVLSYTTALLYCDGVDVRRVDDKLIVPLFFSGVPAVSTDIMGWQAPFDCRLYDNTTGSATEQYGWSGGMKTAPGGDMACLVYVNGASYGTVTYTSGGAFTAQINPGGDYLSLSRGDLVSVKTPGTITGSPAGLFCTMVFGT